MKPNIFRSKAARLSNRKITAFLTIFSLLAGFLVLPPQFSPLLPTAEAAPAIGLSGGSINVLNSAYTENFDTLAASGTANIWTDNTTLPGWYASRSTYISGNGNLTNGGLYSFGSTGASDRALGSIASGTTTTIYWGAKFTNNTGAIITSLDISYIAEQWRHGGATAPAVSVSQAVDFQYQIANAGVVTGINTPSTGWQDHDSLDFSSPTFGTSPSTALDGNASTNRVSRAGTVAVIINPGQEIWLRWRDIDNAGNDHGLGIDDFSVTAGSSGTPTPTATPTPTPSPTATPTPSPTPVNGSPTITAPANPITTVAQDAAPFTVGLTGADDNNVFNWSATAGTGVSNVTVTAGQGTGSVTYTVTLTPGFSGTASFIARLSDNVNPQVSQLVNINVTATPPPPLDHMVISQIYGGGGNTNATYQNDYVELFNAGTVPFDLGGWTIQYSSATNTGIWSGVQPLGGIVQPGEYYLIALGSGSEVRPPLPVTPNVSGSINLSGTTGKVALVSGGDPLDGCPAIGADGVIDLVGYGTANCREGATNAPAPSNTSAIFRKNGGFTDTNVNGADFQTGAPNPRRTTPIQEIGPYVLNVDPRNNSTRAPRDLSVTVNFTESVDVSGAWYDINCASTGSHNDATVVGSGSFRLITPNVTFQPGEQCTATIFANSVSDSDSDDGPGDDNLKADYSWTFTIATGTAPPYPSSVHLTMGNPNGAVADVNQPNNYLMEKPEFSLSYNRDRGTPNWVSWHLTDEWIGSLERIDTFRPDPEVPADWYRVTQFDYANSGFDRGHMTPNADRDPETSIPINQATFLMSNMIPQAPNNNQGPWADMENDLRNIYMPGNEIYIVAGGSGVGGTGSNGGVTTTIANGQITVPAQTWKVALVLPKGEDDISRVSCGTRTIAVIMPNINSIGNVDWNDYITTVDAVEALTGYDFFSELPDPVERCVEAGTNGVNPPLDTDEDGDPDTLDNCPFDANSDQLDTDNDGLGNACDTDDDNDGTADAQDAFPLDPTESVDTDGDGTGNNADADDDNDGVSDTAEMAAGSDPLNAASTPEVCDGIDNDLNDGIDEGFPNTDGDSQADCVDTDDDNDGVSDTAEAAAGSDPLNAASTPEVCDGLDNDLNDGVDEGFANTDGDGQADCIDADDDNDGVSDSVEAAAGSDPLNAASTPEVCDGVDNDLNDGIDEGFANTDGDGQADCVDSDDDNDGVSDTAETNAGSDPLNAASIPEVCDGIDNDLNDGIDEGFINTDGDGQADCVDTDDDNDGVADAQDAFPLDPTESVDTDGDGTGNNADADDDNDGVSDTAEIAAGSDPLNAASTPEVCDGIDNDLNDGVDEGYLNTDGDTQANCVDNDDDNDGVADAQDAFPLDPTESVDTDGDGTGNNADLDDDGDGQSDANEVACQSNPLDALNKAPDNDADNVPDCVDADDDNDGVLDGVDNCPFTANPDQTDFDGDGIGDACDNPAPTSKDQCKDDGWKLWMPRFKNQGDCVQFLDTGK